MITYKGTNAGIRQRRVYIGQKEYKHVWYGDIKLLPMAEGYFIEPQTMRGCILYNLYMLTQGFFPGGIYEKMRAGDTYLAGSNNPCFYAKEKMKFELKRNGAVLGGELVANQVADDVIGFDEGTSGNRKGIFVPADGTEDLDGQIVDMEISVARLLTSTKHDGEVKVGNLSGLLTFWQSSAGYYDENDFYAGLEAAGVSRDKANWVSIDVPIPPIMRQFQLDIMVKSGFETSDYVIAYEMYGYGYPNAQTHDTVGGTQLAKKGSTIHRWLDYTFSDNIFRFIDKYAEQEDASGYQEKYVPLYRQLKVAIISSGGIKDAGDYYDEYGNCYIDAICTYNGYSDNGVTQTFKAKLVKPGEGLAVIG